MAKTRLHLDADVADRRLYHALLQRGHDVTRTPTPWMPADASDKEQFLGATARGRCLFTFNIRDFSNLAKEYPEHHGVILANQTRWTLSGLIAALDRMLKETEAEEWIGQVRWLNDWRD
jgi:hypothetical protein